MKKILIGITTLLLVASLTSCGMKWEQTKKNFKADLGGGLDRTVKVTDADGNIVWSFSGKCYVDEDSTLGDVTIVYEDGNSSKKSDFIGLGFNVLILEN